MDCRGNYPVKGNYHYPENLFYQGVKAHRLCLYLLWYIRLGVIHPDFYYDLSSKERTPPSLMKNNTQDSNVVHRFQKRGLQQMPCNFQSCKFSIVLFFWKKNWSFVLTYRVVLFCLSDDHEYRSRRRSSRVSESGNIYDTIDEVINSVQNVGPVITKSVVKHNRYPIQFKNFYYNMLSNCPITRNRDIVWDFTVKKNSTVSCIKIFSLYWLRTESTDSD